MSNNAALKVSQTIPVDPAASPSHASRTSSDTDAELVRRLRAALRDVDSALLKGGDASECTVDIADSEVVYLILSAAARRVEWLESQLSNVSSARAVVGNDPSAVVRQAALLPHGDDGADVDDDDGGDGDDGARRRRLLHAPAVQRSVSSTSLAAPVTGRVRGATLSSATAPPPASQPSTKIEISGSGLASAVVGRVASFAVRFVGADGKVKHVSGKTPTAVFRAPGGVDVAANVTKCRDGSFALSYTVPAATPPDAGGALDVFINGQRSKMSPYSIALQRIEHAK